MLLLMSISHRLYFQEMFFDLSFLDEEPNYKVGPKKWLQELHLLKKVCMS